MNEPKDIGEIVRDAYKSAGLGDPVERGGNMYKKSEPVTKAPELDHSWLGRYQDVGWAIRITPRLTKEQWSEWGQRTEEAWDYVSLNYNAHKSLELLHQLFPTHQLALTWPKCGYRVKVPRSGQTPVYQPCGAQAQHTEVHQRDVNGARVGIARCDQHKGQL